MSTEGMPLQHTPHTRNSPSAYVCGFNAGEISMPAFFFFFFFTWDQYLDN